MQPRPPTPLTAAQHREIFAILAVGGTFKLAADYCGCLVCDIKLAVKTIPEFADQCKRQALRPELEMLKSLLAAAREPKQWRAAAWALERMYPKRYARHLTQAVTRTDLTQFLAGLVKIITTEVPSPQLRKKIMQRLEEFSLTPLPKATKKKATRKSTVRKKAGKA